MGIAPAHIPTAHGIENKNSKSKFQLFLKQLDIQTMVWPGIIFLLVFAYWPMYGIIIAFKNYRIVDSIMGAKWVGLKHFKAFLLDENFGTMLYNTLGMNIIGLIIGFPIPIIFALLLNELTSSKFKKITQTVSYLPHFISWVIYGGIVINLLSVETGVVNNILKSIGLIKEPVFFLGDPKYFWAIAISTSIIKELGWSAILYLAAIAGVDQEMYEAATIDGAGRFQKMWHITLPSITGTIVILMIFNISGMLNSGFDQIWMLQNSLNVASSETIDTYVYKVGLQSNRFSYATAVGLFKSVISMVLLLIANFSSKKLTDKGLF